MKNEIKILMLHYSFAYFGLKNQLVNDGQRLSTIKKLNELKGWEKEENKKEVAAIYMCGMGQGYEEKENLKQAIKCYKQALKIQLENPLVLAQLCQAYVKKNDFISAENYRQKKLQTFQKYDKEHNQIETKEIAKKSFTNYMNTFYQKNSSIINLYRQKPEYHNILDESDSILTQIQAILKDIRRYFKGKTHKPSKKIILI